MDRSTLLKALGDIDVAGAGRAPSDEAPIFVAGSAWRSGSTLLQRVIMSDPSTLIWGEALEDGVMVSRLAESIAKPGWDRPFWIGNRSITNLQRAWTTLMWPDAVDLKAGLRALFETWFAAPARRRGFLNWGLKEVRWSGDEIAFLKWLYPRARFFLIVRDPVDSYRSLLNYAYTEGDGYHVRWPEQRVACAKDYAIYWRDIVQSWIDLEESELCFIVKYEDVVSGVVNVQDLGHRVGLSIDPQLALSTRVNRGGKSGIEPSNRDIEMISAITSDAAGRIAHKCAPK